MPDSDPIIERLETQISWYDQKSLECQHIYKRIKIAEIVAAAVIPLLAAAGTNKYVWLPWLTGILGVVITVFEGLLQLGQYQQNWITYRSTCEALRHEKYLYLAKAGPYASAPDAHALLAERVESLVSQEHAKWESVQQSQLKMKEA
jgi:hypothetical protein